MIKVCFFIIGLDYSGAEIVLDRYLEGNEEIDPYFILIYENDKVKKLYFEKYGKEKIYYLNLKHNKNLLRFAPWIEINKVNKQSKSIIDKINPDLLYANNTHEVMLCEEVIKKCDIKSMAHIHDMRESVGSPIKRLYMDKAIKKYDVVLTVSEATKKSWNNEKIKVVYNGVDEDFFINGDLKAKEIQNIGYIGKISRRKGFDLLIESFNGDFKNKELYIAYGSFDSEFNEQIKDMKKNNNVKIFYKLNENEIKDFYNSIDLLVVPSRQDPLPTVIIEAMARGCLVIGANTGGIPELINNEKLIFDVDSVKSLKEKMLEIIALDKELTLRYKKQLYNLCKNKFSNRKKVKSVNELINQLVKK